MKFSTRDLCFCAIGAALIAVCAWISIPADVPFTLQTFAIFTVCGLLGGKRGTVSVLVYLLLGAVGAPVFAGFRGGFASLLGTTGGYLVGFVLLTLIITFAQAHWGQGQWVFVLSAAVGLLVCYAFGTAWFLIVYTRTGAITLGVVLAKCVLPFLLPDAVKLALATLLRARLYRRIPLGIRCIHGPIRPFGHAGSPLSGRWTGRLYAPAVPGCRCHDRRRQQRGCPNHSPIPGIPLH